MDSVKISEWAPRAARASVRGGSARHVQVIVAPGERRGQHLVCVVGDGEHLAAVFRVGRDRLGDALTDILHDEWDTVSTPGDSTSWGIQGTTIKPPPPPPGDPSGLPEDFIRSIVRVASRMNDQMIEAAAEAAGR
jgi:hypothetical protein